MVGVALSSSCVALTTTHLYQYLHDSAEGNGDLPWMTVQGAREDPSRGERAAGEREGAKGA